MTIINATMKAVKSLITPNGARAANDALAEMSYPQVASLLPYRLYDEEFGIFINKKTIGFVLKAPPLIGGNEAIVDSLNDLIKTKIPRNSTLTVHLKSSPIVGDILDYGLQDFSWTGKEADKFNRITRAYYQNAAVKGFKTPSGLPVTLRNYELYFSYTEPKKGDPEATKIKFKHIQETISASLKGAYLHVEPVDGDGLLNMVHNLINHRPGEIFKEKISYNPLEDINYQCVEPGIEFDIYPDEIKYSLPNPAGGRQRCRLTNFMLDKNPEMFRLWQSGDNISNLLNPANSIPDPFVMTFIIETEEQAAKQNEATRKFLNKDKLANSTMAKILPSIRQERDEWEDIRSRLLSGESALVKFHYSITLFTEDNDHAILTAEQRLINTYKKNGIDLVKPEFKMLRNWMGILPFMAGEGLWQDLKIDGACRRSESIQAVNLMPVVADNRLCEKGLLAPSYRNQIAFIDVFGDGMGNTNSNMAVSGTSGAGKTGLVQPVLRSVLDSGGLVWVFDMGDGYKSFCDNMGGTYIDASQVSFNPFANVTNIIESGERIRDLMGVLASPDGNLDEVHDALLLSAVESAWNEKKNEALIDDVVAVLAQDVERYRQEGAHTLASRLDEMIVLLGKYCSGGLYGEYFNSKKPSLSDEARLIVLEMGSLGKRPDLLVAVMFSLILYIEDKMYHSPRTLKKVCAIDEGWKLLNFQNKKVGQFIETGYRTVRRHRGAFITISQNIKDFDSVDASSAAKAAWGNSAFKIVAKQDASEFKAYCERNKSQFNEYEKAIIGRFGDAKDQWFSSFMLRINDTCSFHRLFVDPLSRAMYSSKGEDFQFIEEKRKQGWHIHDSVYALAHRNFPQEMAELEEWANRFDLAA
ncbi:TPA: type IV secretion system protein TraC [Citrobacter koseri]|nr:type IV secretion system protein TraC [Citrobacter koseri]